LVLANVCAKDTELKFDFFPLPRRLVKICHDSDAAAALSFVLSELARLQLKEAHAAAAIGVHVARGLSKHLFGRRREKKIFSEAKLPFTLLCLLHHAACADAKHHADRRRQFDCGSSADSFYQVRRSPHLV
jgi:hypothetical protein